MPFFFLENNSYVYNVSWSPIPADRMSEEVFSKAWPKWLFQLLVALLGMLGNGLIICTFYKRLKTNVANYYIFCLAIVDLLSCSVVIPFHTYYTAHYFSFRDNISCKFLEWLRIGLWAASSIVLQATAIGRYQAVCRPFSRRKVGPKGTVFTLVLCVLGGLTISSSFLIMSGAQSYIVSEASVENYGFTSDVFSGQEINYAYAYVCEVLNIYTDSWGNTLVNVGAALIFAFLVTVSMVCYTAVYMTMRKQMKARQHTQPTNKVMPADHSLQVMENNKQTNSSENSAAPLPSRLNPDEQDKNLTSRECLGRSHLTDVEPRNSLNTNQNTSKMPSTRQNQYRAAKTFMIVTVVFLLSWVPFWVQVILGVVDSRFNNYSSITFQILWDFLRELYFLNSALNACVYYVYNATFRHYVQSVFRCKSRNQ